MTTKIMSFEPGSTDDTANGTCKLAGPHGLQVIPGTSLVLVADTDNSLIRMVDLAFSQPSQTVRIPYTNTPYAIKLHHDQRQLYVVNLKNGTVSVTDLYSMSSYILAAGLGMPTDVVVHPPTGRVFVADGQNHTLWVVNETDGSVSWFCGANDPAEGYYLEGNASDARFWVPLGLTYDSKRDVVYVADFRNRVIRSANCLLFCVCLPDTLPHREVDPYTGATQRRIGMQSGESLIVDGTEEDAVLVGPTNLRYVPHHDLVYFTDRNPSVNKGLLRVWNITERTVRTVVGQLQRSAADGNTLTMAGASAAWGVDVSDKGWIAWTEADPARNAIRVVANMPNGTMRARIPCPNGQFLDTTADVCMQCINFKPYNTSFLTQVSLNLRFSSMYKVTAKNCD